MFKKFFGFIAKSIKAYVSKHGLIKSIANTIETVVLSSGIVIYITNVFKRWRLNRKFNKILKNKASENNTHKDITDVGHGVYDENGYRLTSSEIERKNKQTLEEIETLYTDDARECVQLIDEFEPELFNGMNTDQKFKYVHDKNLTPMVVRKKYGMDKESQLRLGRQQAAELDAAWDEDEEPKISAASRVSSNYHKNAGHRPKITSKEQGISICSVIDYAAMEITYGCEDFNFTDPNSETEERKLRRLKFEDTVEVVNSYISYIYLYDKPKWKKLMIKANGDATKIWNFMMIAFLDDIQSYNEAKQFLLDKGETLRSEVRGHFRSTRPKTTSIEQDEMLDKFEDVLERLDLIDNERKLNRNPNQYISTDDDDEEDDDLDIDDIEPSMEDTDDILDQLDALRSGQTNGVSDISEDHTERKPVKLITHNESTCDNDPNVLYINPTEYTIEKRAEMMLKKYDTEYHTDGVYNANSSLISMLEDTEGKNYKVFEVSDYMKNARYNDRKKGYGFKLIPSDYTTNDERQQALKEWQAFNNHYGDGKYLTMVRERSKYYQDLFKYQTVDAMLNMLSNIITDHDEQVAFIRCLRNADDDFSNNIQNSPCVELDKEASIPEPIDIPSMRIVENIEDVSPEEIGVPISEIRNLHNEN